MKFGEYNEEPGYVKYLFEKIQANDLQDCIHFTGILDAEQIVSELKKSNVIYALAVYTSLIEKYISKAIEEACSSEEIFDISTQNQLLIEQLINASSGNMRRLVHLLDSSMNQAYKRNNGNGKIILDDITNMFAYSNERDGFVIDGRFEYDMILKYAQQYEKIINAAIHDGGEINDALVVEE